MRNRILVLLNSFINKWWKLFASIILMNRFTNSLITVVWENKILGQNGLIHLNFNAF